MTPQEPDPIDVLWHAVNTLSRLSRWESVIVTDPHDAYDVVRCLNACAYTLRSLVFKLAHHCEQLVAHPEQLPADAGDDPAAAVHSVVTVLLIAERSLDAAQESIQTADDDMAALFARENR